MSASRPTQEDYLNAWTDLSERLNSGINTLSVLQSDADSRDDTEGSLRLNFKRTGIEQALAIWTRLDTAAQFTRDHAAAWRTFTDEVFATWGSTTDVATRQGLALGLDYQRGYSREIDAPPLVAFASLPAGTTVRR